MTINSKTMIEVIKGVRFLVHVDKQVRCQIHADEKKWVLYSQKIKSGTYVGLILPTEFFKVPESNERCRVTILDTGEF